MKNLHIRTRLIIVLVGVTALLALLRAEGAWRTYSLANRVSELYEFRLVPITALKTISDSAAVSLLRTSRRVSLGLMAPDAAAASIEASWKAVDEAWPRYEAGIDTVEEQQRARELKASLDEARVLSMRARELILKQDLTGLDRLAAASLLPAADEITDRTRGLVALNADLARQTHDSIMTDYRAGFVVSGVLLAVVLILVLVAGVSVVRSISRSLGQVTQELHALAGGEGDLSARIPVSGDNEISDLCKAFNGLMDKLQSLVRRVQESGIKVASSTTQLAASAKQQEASVSQQAASTNQVESAARQIAHTATALARTMDEVSQSARHAAELAGKGRENLVHMEQTIRQVQTASKSIGDKLATINGKAANITGIVTTITKVADQTNLLSLNASIEAAKAGEFGQGFGVVAREIRRLADQTAVSTLDIEQTVKEVQVAVSSGVMSMDKFSEEVRATVEDVSQVSAQLGRVIDEVSVLGPRFIEVGQGMTSQSQGAQQISMAMGELSEAAGQTAEALKESSRAISQLNEAARELQREVARFAGS
jgi:methyl-accepting chemotaxis protein WspA